MAQVTKKAPANSKNTTNLIVLALLVVVLGLAGWLYYDSRVKKPTPPADFAAPNTKGDITPPVPSQLLQGAPTSTQ